MVLEVGEREETVGGDLALYSSEVQFFQKKKKRQKRREKNCVKFRSVLDLFFFFFESGSALRTAQAAKEASVNGNVMKGLMESGC